MQYKQWLWKGSFAAVLGFALTNPVAAQANQSDTSGHNTYNAPFVSIGSGRSLDFQSFTGQFSIDPRVLSRFGYSNLEGQEVSLAEIAELLEMDLELSLEELAMAEDSVQKAASEPRRIVRRGSLNECVNPYIKASEEVERKIEQSKKFIEQVDPIEPQNSLW